MKARLRRIHSPDVYDLENFVPPIADEFGILLQVMAGAEGDDSEESFDVVLCTPVWLERRLSSEPMLGRQFLLMRKYDYRALFGVFTVVKPLNCLDLHMQNSA